MQRFCLKLLSSSSWGCELKSECVYIHIIDFASSSSWGCELKYFYFFFFFFCFGHPLREDVSWNTQYGNLLLDKIPSSSSWGCELKYWALFISMWNQWGHPLREDVSWNLFAYKWEYVQFVILFVRMWVEITLSSTIPTRTNVILFVRMWVEISWTMENSRTRAVILFVRMWVEMLLVSIIAHFHTVILFVRMWVEISDLMMKLYYRMSHPLREDVSWNEIASERTEDGRGHPLHEDVS